MEGEFLMVNGRAASLEAHDPLAGEPFLAIGEIAGRAASARILVAAAPTVDDIERIAGGSIETADELTFDRASGSLRSRRRRRLGALILAEQPLAVPQDEAAALALARGVLSLGLARLPWTNALKQRRDRVLFLLADIAGPRLESLHMAVEVQQTFRKKAEELFGPSGVDTQEVNESDAMAALTYAVNLSLLDAAKGRTHLAPTFIGCFLSHRPLRSAMAGEQAGCHAPFAANRPRPASAPWTGDEFP